MRTLISMTKFVRLVWSMAGKTYIQKLHLLVAYANFLDQILELWMFVPAKLVDGIWVVLEEPKFPHFGSENQDEYMHVYQVKLKEYQEAKDRVLFEGFELKGKHLWNKDKLFMISDNYNESFANVKQIEWLITQSIHEFELTKSAKNQIGI